jgi:MurNAc alpha-1-phosphate uridylyltransferase
MDSLGALSRRQPDFVDWFADRPSAVFDGAPKGRFSINPLWDKAIAKGRLFGLRLDGVWIHVGSPQALEEAETFLDDLARSP